MTAATRQAIEQHGKALLAIFPHATESDPVSLCRKLRRLETAGHRLAERECNDPAIYELADMQAERIMTKLDRLLGFVASKVPVFLNRDPRGYALKIADDYVTRTNLAISRDWGGYGILAPDFGN